MSWGGWVTSSVAAHNQNQYTLEFPRGPLAIGNELVTSWESLRREGQILHLLSRTDSVRDRLLWFYVHNDRSALSAAVGVAESSVIDADEIRRWSAEIGFEKESKSFFSSVKPYVG